MFSGTMGDETSRRAADRAREATAHRRAGTSGRGPPMRVHILGSGSDGTRSFWGLQSIFDGFGIRELARRMKLWMSPRNR
jgi:hypothetical protein